MKTRTPDLAAFTSYLARVRDDAERGESSIEHLNASTVSYAILWFIGSGRAFCGFERACSYMGASTRKAVVARIRAGMAANAALRGSTALVPADLDNFVLAAAIGLTPDNAVDVACNHPWGQPWTLRRAA